MNNQSIRIEGAIHTSVHNHKEGQRIFLYNLFKNVLSIKKAERKAEEKTESKLNRESSKKSLS